MTLRQRHTLTFGVVGFAVTLLLALFLGHDGPLVSRVAWLWPWGIAAVGGALFAVVAYVLLGRLTLSIRAASEVLKNVERTDARLSTKGATGEWKDLLDHINEMLGRLDAHSANERAFLGTASHELRRPLAALRGELELALRKRRDGGELRQAIALALGDAELMSRLVDDLLFHARARTGRVKLRERPVALVDIVYDAIDRSQRALSGSPTIGIGMMPDVHLHVDPEALGQVLENLIVNAHTHAGRAAEVFVAARLHGGRLALSVQDDGPGIPASEQQRVFEPFGRGDRTDSVAGTGLGLAIAKDLVEAHAGVLRLISPVPGTRRGTRFTIVLPGARVLAATD